MDTKVVAGAELQAQVGSKQSAQASGGSGGGDVELVRCYCCGMTEECTPAYIAQVRERYKGCWICGLCAEATKYEVVRSRVGCRIGINEAMSRHVKVCEQFRSSSPPVSPDKDLISAMTQILRRTLDSPRKNGAAAGGLGADCRPLGRSKSCFAAIPKAPSE